MYLYIKILDQINALSTIPTLHPSANIFSSRYCYSKSTNSLRTTTAYRNRRYILCTPFAYDSDRRTAQQWGALIYLGERMNIADGLGLLALGVALAHGVGSGGREGADALGGRPVATAEHAYRVGGHRLVAVLLEVQLQIFLLEPARATVGQLLLAFQPAEDPAEAHVPDSAEK